MRTEYGSVSPTNARAGSSSSSSSALKFTADRRPDKTRSARSADSTIYKRLLLVLTAAARTTKRAEKKILPSRVILYWAMPGIQPQSTPRASFGTNRNATHAAMRRQARAETSVAGRFPAADAAVE